MEDNTTPFTFTHGRNEGEVTDRSTTSLMSTTDENDYVEPRVVDKAVDAEAYSPMNPQWWLANSVHPYAPFPGNPLEWQSNVYDDGTSYEGLTMLDIPHGPGVLRMGTVGGGGMSGVKFGDRYYGEFEYGFAHGLGVYEAVNGRVYVGEFAIGLREGCGVESWTWPLEDYLTPRVSRGIRRGAPIYGKAKRFGVEQDGKKKRKGAQDGGPASEGVAATGTEAEGAASQAAAAQGDASRAGEAGAPAEGSQTDEAAVQREIAEANRARRRARRERRRKDSGRRGWSSAWFLGPLARIPALRALRGADPIFSSDEEDEDLDGLILAPEAEVPDAEFTDEDPWEGGIRDRYSQEAMLLQPKQPSAEQIRLEKELGLAPGPDEADGRGEAAAAGSGASEARATPAAPPSSASGPAYSTLASSPRPGFFSKLVGRGGAKAPKDDENENDEIVVPPETPDEADLQGTQESPVSVVPSPSATAGDNDDDLSDDDDDGDDDGGGGEEESDGSEGEESGEEGAAGDAPVAVAAPEAGKEDGGERSGDEEGDGDEESADDEDAGVEDAADGKGVESDDDSESSGDESGDGAPSAASAPAPSSAPAAGSGSSPASFSTLSHYERAALDPTYDPDPDSYIPEAFSEDEEVPTYTIPPFDSPDAPLPPDLPVPPSDIEEDEQRESEARMLAKERPGLWRRLRERLANRGEAPHEVDPAEFPDDREEEIRQADRDRRTALGERRRFLPWVDPEELAPAAADGGVPQDATSSSEHESDAWRAPPSSSSEEDLDEEERNREVPMTSSDSDLLDDSDSDPEVRAWVRRQREEKGGDPGDALSEPRLRAYDQVLPGYRTAFTYEDLVEAEKAGQITEMQRRYLSRALAEQRFRNRMKVEAKLEAERDLERYRQEAEDAKREREERKNAWKTHPDGDPMPDAKGLVPLEDGRFVRRADLVTRLVPAKLSAVRALVMAAPHVARITRAGTWIDDEHEADPDPTGLFCTPGEVEGTAEEAREVAARAAMFEFKPDGEMLRQLATDGNGTPLKMFQDPIHYPYGSRFLAPGPAGLAHDLPDDPHLRASMRAALRNHARIWKLFNLPRASFEGDEIDQGAKLFLDKLRAIKGLERMVMGWEEKASRARRGAATGGNAGWAAAGKPDAEEAEQEARGAGGAAGADAAAAAYGSDSDAPLAGAVPPLTRPPPASSWRRAAGRLAERTGTSNLLKNARRAWIKSARRRKRREARARGEDVDESDTTATEDLSEGERLERRWEGPYPDVRDPPDVLERTRRERRRERRRRRERIARLRAQGVRVASDGDVPSSTEEEEIQRFRKGGDMDQGKFDPWKPWPKLDHHDKDRRRAERKKRREAKKAAAKEAGKEAEGAKALDYASSSSSSSSSGGSSSDDSLLDEADPMYELRQRVGKVKARAEAALDLVLERLGKKRAKPAAAAGAAAAEEKRRRRRHRSAGGLRPKRPKKSPEELERIEKQQAAERARYLAKHAVPRDTGALAGIGGMAPPEEEPEEGSQPGPYDQLDPGQAGQSGKGGFWGRLGGRGRRGAAPAGPGGPGGPGGPASRGRPGGRGGPGGGVDDDAEYLRRFGMLEDDAEDGADEIPPLASIALARLGGGGVAVATHGRAVRPGAAAPVGPAERAGAAAARASGDVAIAAASPLPSAAPLLAALAHLLDRSAAGLAGASPAPSSATLAPSALLPPSACLSGRPALNLARPLLRRAPSFASAKAAARAHRKRAAKAAKAKAVGSGGVCGRAEAHRVAWAGLAWALERAADAASGSGRVSRHPRASSRGSKRVSRGLKPSRLDAGPSADAVDPSASLAGLLDALTLSVPLAGSSAAGGAIGAVEALPVASSAPSSLHALPGPWRIDTPQTSSFAPSLRSHPIAVSARHLSRSRAARGGDASGSAPASATSDARARMLELRRAAMRRREARSGVRGRATPTSSQARFARPRGAAVGRDEDHLGRSSGTSKAARESVEPLVDAKPRSKPRVHFAELPETLAGDAEAGPPSRSCLAVSPAERKRRVLAALAVYEAQLLAAKA